MQSYCLGYPAVAVIRFALKRKLWKMLLGCESKLCSSFLTYRVIFMQMEKKPKNPAVKSKKVRAGNDSKKIEKKVTKIIPGLCCLFIVIEKYAFSFSMLDVSSRIFNPLRNVYWCEEI